MTRIKSKYIELCVFKYIDRVAMFLVLKRSDEEKINPGIYQMITGTIEKKPDGTWESAIETALREMQEEIQLKPKNLWAVPYVNSFYVFTEDTINISPVFLAEVEDSAQAVLSNEHQSFSWYSFEEAYNKLTWPGQQKALQIINDCLISKCGWDKLTKL